MSDRLREAMEIISTDFSAFCRLSLTIPARDFKSPPNEKRIDMPFVLISYQERFIKHLDRSDIKDKVVLKPRQKGFSTVTLAYCLWKLLFGRNENMLYLIDRFDKCNEFRENLVGMYKSIPEFLRPRGVDILASNVAKNLIRGNRLKIATATENVGRSGSYTMVVCDEYSWYDDKKQSGLSAALTSSCPGNRIWISTPRQEDDIYHQKVRTAEKEGNLFKHDYFEDAEELFGSLENAQAWYDNAAKSLTPAQKARELDCQFRGAAEDLIWYTEPTMFRPISAIPAMCVVSIDLGWSDDTAVLFARDYGGILHIFDELIVNETTIPAVAGRIRGMGLSIKYGVMDAAGKKVDQTSGISSHRQMQQRLGCKFYTRKTEKVEMLRIANAAMLEHRVFVDPAGCPNLIQMFNNYEWINDKIPHNKYSHIHDAFVYLVYNWQKRPKRIQPPMQVERGSKI